MNFLCYSTIILVVPAVFSYDFPENFARCQFNDSNLDDCLKSAIDNFLRRFVITGIPSLHLLPLEPLEADRITIAEGTKVRLVQKYRDAKIYGINNATVENVHFNLDNQVLTLSVFIKQIQQKAKYELNGQFLILTVFGEGDSIITLEDVIATSTIKFKEVIRNGEKYLILKSYKLELTRIENVIFYFTNLFNGDQILADNVLKVVNDNSVEIFNDVIQYVEKSYGDVVYSVLSKFFDYVPVKYILLQ